MYGKKKDAAAANLYPRELCAIRNGAPERAGEFTSVVEENVFLELVEW
jgi:hypothetical protein